jgi:hypothetical protein
MTGEMLVLHYSRAALRRDYLRAGGGEVMCAALLALVTPGSWPFWLALGFGGVFAAFAAHTLIKHVTTIELDETGIAWRLAGPRGVTLVATRIDFDALSALALRYYGRRKDRGKGIVEITIRAGRARLMADQALDGFETLVGRAYVAAEARGLPLDAATSANLASLGYG